MTVHLSRKPWTATRHVAELDLAKQARLQRAAVKDRCASNEVRRMIEQTEQKEIAREVVGSAGHWIEEYEPPAGDGRQRYRVFDPNGNLLTTKWGKPAAEAAVMELITTGKITA